MRAGPSLLRAAGVSGVLTALFCAAFLLFLHPRYETGDDPSMALISAGLHGNPPSELVVFSNVVIGFLLKALYTQAGWINWHGIGLYSVQALTLGALFFAVLWRGPTLRRLLCCLAIAIILLPYWMTLQFTTMTLWAAWSAAWLFVGARAAPAPIARALLILAITLALAASLIRIHAAIVGVILIAPWLIDAVWPLPPRRVVIAFLAAVSLVGVTSVADFLYYRARPDWQAWLDYNHARSQLHDRPLFFDVKPGEWYRIRRIAGWSPVDTFLFLRWIFFDPELYDIQHLRAVARAVQHRLPQLPEVRRQFGEKIARHAVATRIGLPLLLCLCLGGRRWAYLLRTSASLVLFLTLSLWMQRTYKLDDRWLRSMIDLIPLASMLWLAVPPPAARRGERWLRAIGGVVALLYAGQAWRSVEAQVAASELNARKTVEVRAILAHLTDYAGNAERGGQPVFFVTLGRSIQPEHLNPLQSIEVLRDAPILRFGWFTHSPHYRDMLARHGLTDIYTDVVRRPDVLLICDPRDIDNFLRFLRERRGLTAKADPMPGFPKPEKFYGSRVYRLREIGPPGAPAPPQ